MSLQRASTPYNTADIQHIALGWRVRVLNAVLPFGAALGLPILIGGSLIDLRANGAAAMAHIFGYIALYSLLLFAAFVRQIGFTARVIILLTFSATTSTFALALGGLPGPGRILFIGFVVIATLFFGWRGGVAAISVMIIMSIGIATLVSRGQLTLATQWQTNTGAINTPVFWASQLGVQFIVVSIAIASFSFLLRQMTALAVSAVASAGRAEASSQLAEERSGALEAQAARLRDTEQQLRDLVRDLETPLVDLADGVVLAPLVGQIDHARGSAILERMLAAAGSRRARLMIIDVAGVPAIDDQIATTLIQAAEALELLGCQVALTGITAVVASTLVGLDISLDGLTAARSPQEVLALHEW